ncbi:hypothetical protein CDIK_1271 [Cucumispora dikerogammari]|nr:hypothetical protein CDIK_1271 [Cucumispora dikerogammari]
MNITEPTEPVNFSKQTTQQKIAVWENLFFTNTDRCNIKNEEIIEQKTLPVSSFERFEKMSYKNSLMNRNILKELKRAILNRETIKKTIDIQKQKTFINLLNAQQEKEDEGKSLLDMKAYDTNEHKIDFEPNILDNASSIPAPNRNIFFRIFSCFIL